MGKVAMDPERWQRIEQLYHSARKVDPERRPAFLQDACRGDETLRHEVELLLSSDKYVEGFLETPVMDLAARAMAGSVAMSQTESVISDLSGRKIVHYQILEQVGAGGMGVVYKARDLHLDRFVALKVLPPGRVDDESAKSRFLLEAHAASALNHPNIITVHDVASEEGLDFIVMEFVAGKPLDLLIGRKGLKLRDTLKYGFQIAAALEAAHAAGIIHRDLKPGNIMVTESGLVKVLDFGLAKLAPASNPLALTQAGKQTEEGMILGTVAYMSPEQAEGKNLDARSDIFSFGTVLYEMITGQRPFQGDSKMAILSAIIEKDPKPVSTLSGETPIELEKLVSRCLRKDPERRLQHMGDIKLALTELKEESESAQVRVTTRTKAPRRSWPIVASVALVLLGMAIAIALWTRSPSKPASRSEWVQVTNLPDSVSQPALSPDGHMVTFVRGSSTFAATGQIYVKILPDGEPVQLTRDDLQKMSPVFSPDSSKIAYTAVPSENNWDTWMVPVLGGQPQLWLPNASGLVWMQKGRILFSEIKNQDIHMAIVTADESRANERDIYLPPGETAMAHRSYPSPDGRWALIAEMDRAIWLPCRLVPMGGNSMGRQVGPTSGGCTFAAWSADGKWMYLNSNAGGGFHIWRQRFPDGQPEQITSGPGEEEGFAMAPDGKSFITAAGLVESSVWIHDSSGEHQVSLEGYSFDVKFTPDGKRLCYRILKGSLPLSDPSELRLLELDSGRSQPLLPGFPVSGRWGVAYDISPDGQKVVVAVVDTAGKYRLWIAPLDRRSAPHQIPNVEGERPVFGPAGEIFFRSIQGVSSSIFRVHEDGTDSRQAVVGDKGGHPTGISRDGKWLAVRVGGQGPIVVAYPLSGGAPVPILGANACSGDPTVRWSPDGRLLVISVPTTALGSIGRTYLVPLPQGRSLPPLPAGGFHSEAEIAKLPGVQRVDAFDVAASSTPGVYAFARESVQRNLFRVPLR